MKKISGGKIFLGLTLTVLGILLLLEAFSAKICPFFELLFKLWPLFLVYLGTRKILATRKKEAQKETPTPASN